MKFENTEVYNLVRAVYSIRNALSSWDRSDSDLSNNILGVKDKSLAIKLIKAGSEHRKFLRQISIVVDITAPLYWWKEFDTYKIGTTANSTSTMHTLHKNPITLDMFELDKDYVNFTEQLWKILIEKLEDLRVEYINTSDKAYWRALIQLLPSSFLQKGTVTMSYENVLNMIEQRGCHKLREWSIDFLDWVKLLPYSDEFLILENHKPVCK